MDYIHHNPAHDDNQKLYQLLKQLPKIELHRHLEGALRLGTMADIARDYQLDLPGYDVGQFRHLVQMMPSDEASADMFISKFGVLRNFYKSAEIIDRVAYESVIDAAEDNIIYMELRFTPIALGREMGCPLSDVADWVIDAVNRAKAETGIEVGLIVSMNRHESVELGHEFVDIAIANMDRGVVGLDLAGAENIFPGEPFAPVFEKAHKAGLNVTIHAGEWAGPESVREAIEVLGAARLGHGVRTIEDPAVLDMVRERGVSLEVCPTSNVQSGVSSTFTTHPLRKLYAAGVLTTINTDDPSVCGIDLTNELFMSMKFMNFSLDDIKQQILNAAHVSFLPEERKKALVNRLETEFYPASV